MFDGSCPLGSSSYMDVVEPDTNIKPLIVFYDCGFSYLCKGSSSLTQEGWDQAESPAEELLGIWTSCFIIQKSYWKDFPFI